MSVSSKGGRTNFCTQVLSYHFRLLPSSITYSNVVEKNTRRAKTRSVTFLSARQVYTASWGDVEAVIRCWPGDVLHYELGEELEPRKEPTLFDKPTRGTSVEKFKEMVHGHVKVRA